jgi:hypothetical protein
MNLEIEQYPGELKYLRSVIKNRYVTETDFGNIATTTAQPQDTICKTHPDAPHGFDRNASHNADRYVCECEGWEPPKREWVGLTADEIWKCNKAEDGSAVEFHICSAHQNVLDFAEALEAKLKEKNGG